MHTALGVDVQRPRGKAEAEQLGQRPGAGQLKTRACCRLDEAGNWEANYERSLRLSLSPRRAGTEHKLKWSCQAGQRTALTRHRGL